METKTITVKISRFNPEVDMEPRLLNYQVPLEEGLTVLGALDYVYENLDSTLAYYDHAACAQGICKTCLAKINGSVLRMCQTTVEGDITVEPVGKFKVVRDLVTQREKQAS
jgi:succinate dehydrogenase/fumarate reductase-like Fe-S protein